MGYEGIGPAHRSERCFSTWKKYWHARDAAEQAEDREKLGAGGLQPAKSLSLQTQGQKKANTWIHRMSLETYSFPVEPPDKNTAQLRPQFQFMSLSSGH